MSNNDTKLFKLICEYGEGLTIEELSEKSKTIYGTVTITPEKIKETASIIPRYRLANNKITLSKNYFSS